MEITVNVGFVLYYNFLSRFGNSKPKDYCDNELI